MKISARDKIIIVVAVIVIVAVAIVGLLIYPQFARITNLGAQIEQADQDVQAAQNLLAQRQSSKTRASETETRLLRLANQLPESPELPGLIIELQDVANEAGVVFETVTPGDVALDDGGWESVDLTVDIEGRWVDTVDYLQRLRRLTRQIRIVDVDSRYLQPEEPEEGVLPGPGSVETRITLRAYMLSADAAGQPSEDATAPPTAPEGQ